MSAQEYESKKLAEMNGEEMHYLINYTDEVADSYISTANSMYSAANETEQSLSSQLMLLNTVILTASLIALGNNDLFKQITTPHKFLICSIFVLQVISIAAGILNYKNRERFFAEAGSTASVSARIARDRKYKTLIDMQQELKRNDAKQPDQSSDGTLKAQIASIIVSLIFFVLLILGLLFDIPWYKN